MWRAKPLGHRRLEGRCSIATNAFYVRLYLFVRSLRISTLTSCFAYVLEGLARQPALQAHPGVVERSGQSVQCGEMHLVHQRPGGAFNDETDIGQSCNWGHDDTLASTVVVQGV